MGDLCLTRADLADLAYAKRLLEHPSLAARIAGRLGTPIEKGFDLLPRRAASAISSATKKSIETALRFAISTMDERPKEAAGRVHKTMVTMTGALGGAFGLPALVIELPVSTTIMLRSIVDIARSEGESIKSPETKLACIEVFALGGPTRGDDAAESGYFAVRAALAKTLADAADHITQQGIAQKGAPALVRFVTQVAARFGIPVSEKVVAQSLPIVGAAGGALINALFIGHFQEMARGHFTIRRLERMYDPEMVKKAYLELPAE